MEQIGDIIERVLQDIEDKKIQQEPQLLRCRHGRDRATCTSACSPTCGWRMSVFLDGHVRDAQQAAGGEGALPRPASTSTPPRHIARLQDNTTQSIETSSLHLDLISDLKRINSHICSIAYPILESAGALTATRIRPSVLAPMDSDLQKSE